MATVSGLSGGAIVYEFGSTLSVVESGAPFALRWRVDADQVDLYRNGVLLQSLNGSEGSLQRSEFHDGTDDVIYELLATKNGLQARSNKVVIRNRASKSRTPGTFSHALAATVPWVMFVSIFGLLFGLGFLVFLFVLVHQEHLGTVEFLFFLMTVACFFPLGYLLSFAIALREARKLTDPQELERAFRQLRNYFISFSVIILLGFLFYLFLLIREWH